MISWGGSAPSQLFYPMLHAADYGNAKFVWRACLHLYYGTIADNTTLVVRVHAGSACQSCFDAYTSHKAAEHSTAKFLCNAVDKVV